MSKSDRLGEELRRIATEIAASCGVDLYDVVLRRSGPRWKLQIFLTKSGGNVSLEDCERVSRQLSRELDVSDPIPSAYDLEVSSPGIERHLREPAHWSSACGSNVRVRWRDEQGRSRSVLGRLESLEGDVIRLTEQGGSGDTLIPLDSVLSARVHVDW